MDPTVRANAYAISYRLIGDRDTAGTIADAAALEVDRTGGVGAPEWLGFLASRTVAASLAAAGSGAAGADPGGRREALRRRLRDCTGEQRAAAALVHLAGYPVDVVARHLSLDEQRVAELAAPLAPPPGTSWRDLGDPDLRRATATTAAPVVRTTDTRGADEPGNDGAGAAGSPAPELHRHPRRSRRAPWAVPMVLAVVVVALVVLGVSRAVGERPTLGARAAGVSGPAGGPDVVPLPSAGCGVSPTGAPPAGGVEVRAVETPDGNRTYRLWNPPPAPQGDGTTGTGSAPAPFVLAVPGFGQGADRFASVSGMDASLGARAYVATLDPTTPDLEVNVAQDTTRPDDLLYALAVYDDVVSARCVDLHRTAVIGYGPGGQLATVLACTRPEYFGSVVAVHGAFVPDPCRLDPPVSFLGVWTADDAVLPVGGGTGVDLPLVAPGDPAPTRVPAPAADEVVERWSDLVGATDRSTSQEADGTRTVLVEGGRDGARVVAVTRPTGGHPWPGGIDERVSSFLEATARATG